MNITVCDDDIRTVNTIKKHCIDYIKMHSLDITVNGITDVRKLKGNLPDILILDIEMPYCNGIEVKNRLSTEPNGPLIIFITSYTEYVGEAFGKNVIGLLGKPVELEKFALLLGKCIQLLRADRIVALHKAGSISSKNIVWIKVDNYYTEILTDRGKKISFIRKQIKTWQTELKNCGFLRINESCLVNCQHIKRIDDNNVILNDSEEILTISRRKKTECKEKFTEYCGRMAKYT
ncbi:MAG: LytTR family DNA-binding domain-containing protein [Lachnospiraceae bacterium]